MPPGAEDCRGSGTLQAGISKPLASRKPAPYQQEYGGIVVILESDMMKTLVLVAALTLGATLPAAAVTLFEDTFDYGDQTVLNATSATFDGNWVITSGSVDYLNPDDDFGALCGGHPGCVDLDGTTNDAGSFSTAMVFGPGIYDINFQIWGNNRGAGDDEVTITFGDLTVTFLLGQTQAVYAGLFGDLFNDIVVTTSTVLTFSNAGGDNMGAVLKYVSVDMAPIPLPAAGGLMIAALGALAALRRRRAAA
jgi:hypothetical protein